MQFIYKERVRLHGLLGYNRPKQSQLSAMQASIILFLETAVLIVIAAIIATLGD